MKKIIKLAQNEDDALFIHLDSYHSTIYTDPMGKAIRTLSMLKEIKSSHIPEVAGAQCGHQVLFKKRNQTDNITNRGSITHHFILSYWQKL